MKKVADLIPKLQQLNHVLLKIQLQKNISYESFDCRYKGVQDLQMH